MEVLLKRISVTNTYENNYLANIGFNAYVESISDIFLKNMGKYKIPNTALIELSYLHKDVNYSSIRGGVSILRTGNISRNFDFAMFLKISDVDEQFTFIVKDIYERILTFAKQYFLPIKPIEIAYERTLHSDCFIKIDHLYDKINKLKVILNQRRNLYNTMTYKVEVENGCWTKEVEIDTLYIYGINDFPNMSIDEYISKVPVFKMIGFVKNEQVLFQYGDNNRFNFVKYWLNINDVIIDKEIIKFL